MNAKASSTESTHELLHQPNAELLRIFIGSRDMHLGRNLYEVIVQEARAAGLAGATVLEGFLGYGATSMVHHASLWRISQDLPVIIEIIDASDKIRAFLPQLKVLLGGGGLVTLEVVTILHSNGSAAAEAEDG
jgi:PII-like signaling protein